MNRSKLSVGLFTAIVMAGLVSANPARSQAEFGTADEAKAMLEHTIAVVAADPAAALVRITSCGNSEGCSAGFEAFRDRDLYPYCEAWAQGGTIQDAYVAAHGTSPALIGRRVDSLTDVTGFAFGQALLDGMLAAGDGVAEVAYTWTRPGVDGQFPKLAYLRMVPGQNIFCGVGIYLP